jgi:hypothetical protein
VSSIGSAKTPITDVAPAVEEGAMHVADHLSPEAIAVTLLTYDRIVDKDVEAALNAYDESGVGTEVHDPDLGIFTKPDDLDSPVRSLTIACWADLPDGQRGGFIDRLNDPGTRADALNGLVLRNERYGADRLIGDLQLDGLPREGDLKYGVVNNGEGLSHQSKEFVTQCRNALAERLLPSSLQGKDRDTALATLGIGFKEEISGYLVSRLQMQELHNLINSDDTTPKQKLRAMVGMQQVLSDARRMESTLQTAANLASQKDTVVRRVFAAVGKVFGRGLNIPGHPDVDYAKFQRLRAMADIHVSTMNNSGTDITLKGVRELDIGKYRREVDGDSGSRTTIPPRRRSASVGI